MPQRNYSQRKAAPIVSIVHPDALAFDSIAVIDSALEHKGYEKQAPTLTVLLDLSGAVEIKSNLANSSIKKGRRWIVSASLARIY